MPRIQQLSSLVINQIAAGEVIERPASVVKELLENAVDAGASRIDIDLEQGGADLIRIVDDGCGVLPDDLPLAFANHATSKLSSAEDLFSVGTLGFRGEALASIGSIARVSLQSRPPEQSTGAEITCHGGELSPVRPWNGAPGTRIEVRHLFYNTPVRRRFLRGPGTELGHVTEVFTRLALSQLRLHLTLRHNGKVVFEIPGTAGLLDRIGLFFGNEVREHLYSVEAEHDLLTLGGYIADPACERGSSQMQYFFLNGRWVRDRLLAQSLQEAYRGLLMTGRHAVAFLFLDLPADQLDVNVHPTKAEVRFRESEEVQEFVLSAIRRRLEKEDLTARLRAPLLPGLSSPGVREHAEPQAGDLPQQRTGPVAPTPAQGELTFSSTPFPPPTPPVPRPAPSPTPSAPPANKSEPRATPVRGADRQTPPPREVQGVTPRKAFAGTGTVKAVQLHDLYLVVEVPEGMLVIDQHALHERVLFEQLKDRLHSGHLEKQRLLIPETVDLLPAQAALVVQHRTALAELGLDIEDFGGNTVLLGSYPAILEKAPVGLLHAVADYLATRDRAPTREEFFNDLLSLMACHSAVRAGDRLEPEEIAALVAQRDLARDSHHCPHGRPTTLLFTLQDLHRQFRRT